MKLLISIINQIVIILLINKEINEEDTSSIKISVK